MRIVLVVMSIVLLSAACGTGRPLAQDHPRQTPTPSAAAVTLDVTATDAPLVESPPRPAAPTPTSAPPTESAVPIATAEATPTAEPSDAESAPQMLIEATPEPATEAADATPPAAVEAATPLPAEPAAASYTSPSAALPGAAPRVEVLARPPGSYLEDATVVSLYGYPGICVMGELGCHSPDRMVGAVQQLADRYDALNGDRGAIAAIHLIVDVAQPDPRSDGSYLGRMSEERIAVWVELARRHGLLLFLDLQIGWTEPVDSVQRLAPFLDEPFVHIAIDPEFATRSKGVAPGEAVGQVNAEQVNALQRYLAGFVREHSLPPKLLIIHQFRTSMLIEPERFASVPEVELSIDMDGVGLNRVKLDGYWRYALAEYSERPTFKLFLQRDLPQVLTPEQVLAFETPPDYVIYQ